MALTSSPTSLSGGSPVEQPGGELRPAAPPAKRRAPKTERVISPNSQVTLWGMFEDIFAHRDLLLQLAERDVRIRYKQATMGVAWAVLTPLFVIGAGIILRIAMVSFAGGTIGWAEIGGIALKSFPWAFFVGAIGFGVQSITSNITLVTKVYFPRAVLPLAAVTANLFDLSIGACILVLVLPFVGAQLTLSLLWVPVLVLLLVLFTAAASVFLACANLFFRDVKYIVQVILTFGVFFTPVLFDAAALGRRGAPIVMLNPLAPLFEGLRLAVFGNDLLTTLVRHTLTGPIVVWHPWYLAYSAAWSVIGLALALVLFQRTQFLFAEYV